MDYKDFVVLLGLDTKATGRWVFKKSVEVKKADLAKVSFCLRYTHRGRQQRRALCRGGARAATRAGRTACDQPTRQPLSAGAMMTSADGALDMAAVRAAGGALAGLPAQEQVVGARRHPR